MSTTSNALDDPAVRAVLAREHRKSEDDDAQLAAVRSRIEAARQAGASATEQASHYPKTVYLAVAPDMGRFLYLTARTSEAQRIVEFGTSFGISTIYFAAAATATGGQVIGSELEPSKADRARANLEEAGLAAPVEIRVGDAMETLADVPAPIDLLFLDGWKDLYLPVLQMLEPKLAPGSLVLADNIHTFPDELAPYVDFVSRTDGPYRSVVLPFESGLAYSLFEGA
ncbi:MAG: O-methyltransferase [Methyloligellaceae bacterium]